MQLRNFCRSFHTGFQLRSLQSKVAAPAVATATSTTSTASPSRKEAITNGPGLEDFIEGNVSDDKKWTDYSGDLVKTKEMKRFVQVGSNLFVIY